MVVLALSTRNDPGRRCGGFRALVRGLGPVFLLAALAWLSSGRAGAQPSKEYQVKAAFLFNFTQFVKWPPQAFPSPDTPLTIGVLGSDPFGGALEAMVQGESINHHPLTVVHSQNPADLLGCQLIFVSRSEKDRIGEVLSAVGSRPVLTVSDVDDFARQGGDIDLYLSDGRVRFEINPGSIRRGGLEVSSQLLTLGRIVGGGD